MRKLAWTTALLVSLVLASTEVTPSTAQAQPVQVTPTAKGIIGVGLFGAELGFAIPALAGLDQAWGYVVFPVLGATGGALAGYFLIEQNDLPEVAVASLAIGMALVIPTMVLTLSATAYDPDDDPSAVEEEPAADDGAGAGEDTESDGASRAVEPAAPGSTPPAEGGAAPPGPAPAEGGAAPAPGPTGRHRATGRSWALWDNGLLRVNPHGVQLGLPVVAAVGTYSTEELRRYGLDQRAEVRVPVFSAVF